MTLSDFFNLFGFASKKKSVQPVILVNDAGNTYEAGSGGGGGGSIDISTLAKEAKQNLAVWETIAGNNKVLSYYTGVSGGNPSGSTANIQTIQYRTGATVVIIQTLTYDVNNNILSITAA